MKIMAPVVALALAVSAAPLSAQIVGRDDGPRPGLPRLPLPIPDDGGVLSREGEARGERGKRGARGPSRVPPGHLPPPGQCRVWIDGVPPGHQPAVTDCATAQRQRLQHRNARVIYGDREAFPGRGKGRVDRDRDDDDIFGIDRDDDDEDRRGRKATAGKKQRGRAPRPG
jgi:hypothetical protein